MSGWKGFENDPRVKAAIEHENKRESKGKKRAALKHKFGAKKDWVNDIRFDSKLEASYYRYLLSAIESGDVLLVLRQVPFHLPGGTILRVDFAVFWANGEVTFDDAKGVETDEFKIKKREVEAIHGVTIRVIKKGSFDQHRLTGSA